MFLSVNEITLDATEMYIGGRSGIVYLFFTTKKLAGVVNKKI